MAYLLALEATILSIATRLGASVPVFPAPSVDEPLAMWRSAGGLRQLLVDFLDYDPLVDVNSITPHGHFPYWTQGEENVWLEQLLTSEVVLKTFGFKDSHRSRKVGPEDILQKPKDRPTSTREGLRVAVKRNYGGALSPLPDSWLSTYFPPDDLFSDSSHASSMDMSMDPGGSRRR